MTANELLEKRRLVLIHVDKARYHSAAINPGLASPDGKYIRIEKASLDALIGWFAVESLAENIVSVLEEYDDAKG